MKIVIMGVTGCGKTTVGMAVAERLGIKFIDSDDLHSESNKKKMSSGIPLTDLDREPWLHDVGKTLHSYENIVVACSALKKSYRAIILKGAPTTIFFHLTGAKELIASRLRDRSHHFMPIELLDSQFETLENFDQKEAGVEIGIDKPIEDIVTEILVLL
jgi:carbohydrate kinase (thermoresistant glucokinase family)